MKKYLSSGLIILSFVLGFVPVTSFAVTTNTDTSSTICLDFTSTISKYSHDASTAGAVSQIQNFFGITPTGYFGPKTIAAVRKFQVASGISSTGNIGPRTAAQIKAATCTNAGDTLDSSESVTTNSITTQTVVCGPGVAFSVTTGLPCPTTAPVQDMLATPTPIPNATYAPTPIPIITSSPTPTPVVTYTPFPTPVTLVTYNPTPTPTPITQSVVTGTPTPTPVPSTLPTYYAPTAPGCGGGALHGSTGKECYPITITGNIDELPPAPWQTTPTEIEMTGIGFTSYTNVVHFGSYEVDNVYSPGESLTFNEPTQLVPGVTYPVYVTNSNGTSNTVNFTPAFPDQKMPQLLSISPTTGPVGTVVTLTGTGFGTLPTQNEIQINGGAIQGYAGLTNNPNQITFKIPKGWLPESYCAENNLHPSGPCGGYVGGGQTLNLSVRVFDQHNGKVLEQEYDTRPISFTVTGPSVICLVGGGVNPSGQVNSNPCKTN